MIINGVSYTPESIASMIDFAVLDPAADAAEVKRVCELAIKYKVKGVHPNPLWAPRVADLLEGTDLETGIVVAFPFGALATELKVSEAVALIRALRGRPACIDVVTCIGKLKGKEYDYFTNDIAEVVKVGHDAGYEVKAILEVAMLSDEEVATASKCAAEAGVDFVKTSTGRGGNPEIKHVKIMRASVPDSIGVKFAGYGSYNSAQLTLMAIAAGATRLGTRRAVEICDELRAYYIDTEIRD